MPAPLCHALVSWPLARCYLSFSTPISPFPIPFHIPRPIPSIPCATPRSPFVQSINDIMMSEKVIPHTLPTKSQDPEQRNHIQQEEEEKAKKCARIGNEMQPGYPSCPCSPSNHSPCFSHALSAFHFDPSSRSPSSYIPSHHPFYVPEESRNETDNNQETNKTHAPSSILLTRCRTHRNSCP